MPTEKTKIQLMTKEICKNLVFSMTRKNQKIWFEGQLKREILKDAFYISSSCWTMPIHVLLISLLSSTDFVGKSSPKTNKTSKPTTFWVLCTKKDTEPTNNQKMPFCTTLWPPACITRVLWWSWPSATKTDLGVSKICVKLSVFMSKLVREINRHLFS